MINYFLSLKALTSYKIEDRGWTQLINAKMCINLIIGRKQKKLAVSNS